MNRSRTYIVYFYTILILSLSFSSVLVAQSNLPWAPELGIPYIKTFKPKEYGGDFQNWCFAQNRSDLLYVANNEGLLEYDGAEWRLIRSGNAGTLRSVAINELDTIFVGTESEFGYFTPGDEGELQYYSLRPYMSAEFEDFNETIWYTLCLDTATLFMSNEHVFRWKDGELSSYKPQESAYFLTIFASGGDVYALQYWHGLTRFQGDEFSMIPSGDFFAERAVYAMASHREGSTLFGSYTYGLFNYDGQSVEPLETDASEFGKRYRFYCGAALSNGQFAFGTLRGGLAIIDQQGNLVQVFNKESGLLDNAIHFIYEDHQGGIWLAQQSGIARVEISAPLTILGSTQGVEGKLEAVERQDETLYVATTEGLFSLVPGSWNSEKKVYEQSRLERPFRIGEQAMSLLSTEAGLLVGTVVTAYQVVNNEAIEIPDYKTSTFSLTRSKVNPDWVFTGARHGLAILALSDERWNHLGWVEELADNQIHQIEEDTSGTLWLNIQGTSILRVQYDVNASRNNIPSPTAIQTFTSDDGLPEAPIRLTTIDGHIIVSGSKAIVRYNSDSGNFEEDLVLGDKDLTEQGWAYFAAEDVQGTVWASTGGAGNNTVAFGERLNDGKYSWTSTPLQRMVDVSNVIDIYPEPNGTVWICGEQLFRYSPGKSTSIDSIYLTHVRRVVVSGDSVVHNGSLLRDEHDFNYGLNPLRFEFSATTFDAAEETQYKSRLEGLDRNWTGWTTESRREFTNLAEGDYTFRVQARNVYGVIGREAMFSFTIAPPLYRTWWAYVLYILLAGVAVLGLVKLRVRQLHAKTIELEALVAERTSTIRQQAEKLQEMDRLKSRFFANISHELRTPLTLILGPLASTIRKLQDPEAREELGVVHRNANRLLKLINQLLDISRLESGKINLRLTRGNFVELAHGIVMSFASLAAERQIGLKFECPKELGPLLDTTFYYDQDKIEKILVNLLSNAFKFTGEGGSVLVELASSSGSRKSEIGSRKSEQLGADGSDFRLPKSDLGDSVEIMVKDSGIGIPAEQLPHVFNRFYQADNASTRKYDGTGIGLALVKELVEVHKGVIAVESQRAVGTTFTITLPLGASAFPQEIDEQQLDEATSVATMDLEPEPMVSAPTSGIKPQSTKSGHPHVLIVEDHHEVRQYICGQLRDTYSLIEAADGEEGLQLAENHVPDLIISDVMMPNLDGFQLCEKLKTTPVTSHIPVILLTARAGEESKIVGLETGADDYLVKPFSPKELQVRVKNLIEQRRSLQRRFRKEGFLSPDNLEVTSTEKQFLEKLKQVLDQHLVEEDFGIDILCDELTMSRRQLQRKIRALTDESPTELIRSARLERAKILIEEKAGTVSEIAYAVGFNNLSYFSRVFRERFGQSPSELGKG